MIVVLGLGLGVWSCAGLLPPRREETRRPTFETRKPVYSQRGIASWYGEEFHGNPTASGEIYDMYELTAAHRTLPLGTPVMVTNLENHRSVGVRINDRGPFVKGRIIDLSYGAARAIGIVEKGTARVEVVAFDLTEAPNDGAPVYTVQVGSFSRRENAERLLKQLQEVSRQAYMTILKINGGNYYRVRVGRYGSRETAYRMAEKLASRGYAVLITSR